MADGQIRFKVDAHPVEGYLGGTGDAVIAALVQRTTVVNSALQAKIMGKVNGGVLQSHTGKLTNSVRVIPTQNDGNRITGGVQAGGGPAFYTEFLEDGSKPHIIQPKDPKGVLSFMVGDKQVFAKLVHHPGTKAYLFMKGTLAEEKDYIREQLNSAVCDVLNPRR